MNWVSMIVAEAAQKATEVSNKDDGFWFFMAIFFFVLFMGSFGSSSKNRKG